MILTLRGDETAKAQAITSLTGLESTHTALMVATLDALLVPKLRPRERQPVLSFRADVLS